MKIKVSKKLTLLITITALVLTFTGNLAVAQVDLTGPLGNVGTNAGFTTRTPDIAQTIGLIIKGLLSLLGIIFMGYIIYAGSLWITARGKEEQLEKAKAIIRGSIVGIIIVLSAYAITDFVVDNLSSATGFEATQSSSI